MKNLSVQVALSLLGAIQQGNGIAVVPNAEGRPVNVRSKVMYIAGLGTELSGRNGELIDSTINKSVGITNFDNGDQLNKGRNLLVVGLRMRFDTTADVTAKTATWLSDAPAVFKNGELVIYQDGTGNLLEMPISAISKYNASIPTEDEFIEVTPFMIREGATFKLTAKLAGATAANQAYRLDLLCYEFTDAKLG